MNFIKNKYSIICLTVFLVLLGSCTKEFEDINKPYNQPSEASIGDLFNTVVSSMQNSWQELATYHSFIYPLTQQTTQYASSGYRLENASNEVWQSYYSMLANSKLIDTLISQDENSGNMTNILAMNRVLRAYKTMRLTEEFGDVPFHQAGYAIYGIDFYKPRFDTQQEVYKALINDLKWAVDNLSTAPTQVSLGSSETFLKNNIPMWIKFANALRLRCAITIYDKDAAFAGPQIAEAISKPLIANGEDIGLWPSKIPGLVFEIHAWSLSANQYIRLGTTMWNAMSNSNAKDGSGIFDPRCRIFYEPNQAGEWVPYPQNPTSATPSEGGDPYNQSRFNSWSSKGAGCIFSPINFYFEDKNFLPQLMITAAQVHLYLAEVYQRGLGVAKNDAMAKAHYEAGVKASVNFWTKLAIDCPIWVEGKPAGLPSDNVLNVFLQDPKVAYSSDPALALKQIYTQLWIDGFRQPWDIWTLYRRTGGNLPKDPDNASYTETTYGIYHRYIYPTSEQDFNTSNWKTAMGGQDKYETKTWLEK